MARFSINKAVFPSEGDKRLGSMWLTSRKERTRVQVKEENNAGSPEKRVTFIPDSVVVGMGTVVSGIAG